MKKDNLQNGNEKTNEERQSSKQIAKEANSLEADSQRSKQPGSRLP